MSCRPAGVALATSACSPTTEHRCPVPSSTLPATSPATEPPTSTNAPAAAATSTAPTSITRRSPNRSAACPDGTASTKGATAKHADKHANHVAGTPSSSAR